MSVHWGPDAAGPLAQRQAALVDALVAGGPAPPGFDAADVDATLGALLRKRAREAAAQWPLLAASYGDRWPSVFAEHRAGHGPVGALRDGWDVARAVTGLPPGAAAELAGREAAWRYDGRRSPRPRRWRRLLGRVRRGR
ncbi:hypothetical protein [Pseudonocardia hydrocarbonoxydans]|uniref:hypothetical protein n=1 Tax=Pseudonocardia hydrocarbonoxydans TaxID=76726 RepID=UPI0031D8795F